MSIFTPEEDSFSRDLMVQPRNRDTDRTEQTDTSPGQPFCSKFSKASHAIATPSSFRICSPIAEARSEYAGLSNSCFSSVAARLGVNCHLEIVRAIPKRTRRSPLSGWSHAWGTTSIGRPARIASPVVPTPPWWTIAAALGNSSVKEAYSTEIASEHGTGRQTIEVAFADDQHRSAVQKLDAIEALFKELGAIP